MNPNEDRYNGAFCTKVSVFLERPYLAQKRVDAHRCRGTRSRASRGAKKRKKKRNEGVALQREMYSRVRQPSILVGASIIPRRRAAACNNLPFLLVSKEKDIFSLVRLLCLLYSCNSSRGRVAKIEESF